MGNHLSRRPAAGVATSAAGTDVEAQSIGAGAADDSERGLYFGPHFVLGGQEYSTAPDAFLFGGLTSDFSPITAFGLSRMGHPTPDVQTTTTLKCNVYVHKNTVKLVTPPSEEDSTAPTKYGLSFVFDADTPCTIQLFLACTETINSKCNAVYSPLRPETPFPAFPFPKGLNQTFSLPPDHLIDLSKFAISDLQIDHDGHVKGVYPLVIAINSFVPTETTWSFSGLGGDRSNVELKVLKQKVVIHGVSFLLHEIFGIEQCTQSQEVDSGDNTRECVVCMSDPKDTVVLPCRHLCLCCQCAEQFRFQSNKCPICRQPFHALLQIKIGPDKPQSEVNSQPEESTATIAPPDDVEAGRVDSDTAGMGTTGLSKISLWQQAAQTGEAPLEDVSKASISKPLTLAGVTNYTPLTSFNAPQRTITVNSAAENDTRTYIIPRHIDDDGVSDDEPQNDAGPSSACNYLTTTNLQTQGSSTRLVSATDDELTSGDELDTVVAEGGKLSSIDDPLGASQINRKPKKKVKGTKGKIVAVGAEGEAGAAPSSLSGSPSAPKKKTKTVTGDTAATSSSSGTTKKKTRKAEKRSEPPTTTGE